MRKVEEAKEILKAMGLGKEQQNELSALVLLALCGLKEEDDWKNAASRNMRVTKEIMTFVNENYKKDSPYAPNTRETFRRHVLHQFVQAGVAKYNPGQPDLPVNSPLAHYALSDEALYVVKSYGTSEWDSNVSRFEIEVNTARNNYENDREICKVPIIIDGEKHLLSPGRHNELQVAVINEFAPRFAQGGRLLYLGDTEDKDLYIKSTELNALKINITEHSKLPDIIICDDLQAWLYLIEVVTSHGPVSPKRVLELESLTKDCAYGIVYVTAFPDITEFKKHLADIAWETEVWLADSPDHMIHFNGDRFIGPRR